MGNFSKPPLETLAHSLEQGYVGLHLEQGVPVLDRDLNLLNDLIAATVRRVIARYIGDGVAAGSDGFAIQSIAAANDFRILAGGVGGAGSCLAGGIEVTIAAPIRYRDQPGVAALTTPDATQPDPREDTAYLDVWLAEVDDGQDAELLNPDDVGIRTSVRLRPAWRVRVAEGVPIPDPEPGHTHTPLARLIRPRGEATIGANLLVDLRQTRLNLAEVERRLRAVEELSLIPAFAAPNQFIPPVGAPGTEVRLFGRNFNVGTPRVLFGPREATVVGTPTATEIVATVPEDVEGLVRITVITDGGTAVSDETFNVLPGAPVGDPPEFAESPQFIPPVGAASTPVRLLGNHFDGPNLHVAFGGEEAAVDSVTATQIIARVPSGISGQVTISVETDFGSATSTATFQVL